MLTRRGNMIGTVIVDQDTDLHGNIRGDVVVRSGCFLNMHGNLMGDIVLEGDARADVRGNMNGQVRRATGF